METPTDEFQMDHPMYNSDEEAMIIENMEMDFERGKIMNLAHSDFQKTFGKVDYYNNRDPV